MTARLEHDTTGPDSLDVVISSLMDVEQSLRALSEAVSHAADALIPPASLGESVASRYARAAANWPRRGDGPPPSYERQAQLLASLHDARATLRAGAESCRRARTIVESTDGRLAPRC